MCSRRTGKYKEEICGPKKEEEPHCQLLDAVFNLQPRIVLRRADITENLNTKWKEPEPLHLKQEMEDEDVHHIKKEEEQILIKKEEEEAQVHIKKEEEENITKFPSTGVHFKSEDEGQSEESRGGEPPSSNLNQQMRRESDGNHKGRSHPECHHRSGLDDCRFYRFPRKKLTLWARSCRRSDRQPTQPNDRLDGLMEHDPVYFAHNPGKWIDSPDPGKSSQEQSETFFDEMATNSQQLEDEHVQTADGDAHEDHTYASTACSPRYMALITKLKEEVKVLQKNVEDLTHEYEKRKPMSLSGIKGREKKCRKCCDRRVKMSARTSVKYKEDVCGPKKPEETQCQLLDAVFNLQPRIVQCRADVSENLHPERQQSISCHIKEEDEGEEVQHIKEDVEEVLHMKEEKQEGSIQVPSTGVHLKSEDEGRNEERRGGELPSRNSSSDGDLCKRSQTDGHDDDDDGQSEGECRKCCQCRKTFASLGSLKRHMKIHTGEKPFACSVCGQRFTQKEHLKRHTRTHTGEKPFSCSVCGQRFAQKGYLKIHTRRHTSEKPFSFSVCGQKFTHRYDLQIHTRTHTGEKPFSCSICGKRFSVKGTLNRHTRIHTGEKPFSCSICGQRFSQKGSLKVHCREMHDF